MSPLTEVFVVHSGAPATPRITSVAFFPSVTPRGSGQAIGVITMNLAVYFLSQIMVRDMGGLAPVPMMTPPPFGDLGIQHTVGPGRMYVQANGITP